VLLRRREELRRLSRGQLGIAALAGAILALHFALWITSLGFTSIVQPAASAGATFASI